MIPAQLTSSSASTIQRIVVLVFAKFIFFEIMLEKSCPAKSRPAAS
jgi:hypothetical protein